MTAGIYVHKPHSKATRDKIGMSHKGKHYHTEDSKKRIGEAHKGKNNHRWKGDDAVKISNHIFVAKYKPKPKCCEKCGQERKLNLANIKEHKYTKNLGDYKWLCYSCHKKFDMKCSYCGKKDCKLSLRMVCDDCYEKGFNVWKENFIRLLKKELRRPLYGIPVCSCSPYSEDQADPNCLNCKIMKKIDKLAGDKLLKGDKK